MSGSEVEQTVKNRWTTRGECRGKPVLEHEKCCFLCQSANRALSGLFTPDVSSTKLRKCIHKYLKIKVTHLDETSGFICVDCVERLNSLRWFDHQGRKNDLFLKSFPTRFLISGERYCRLCLCTTSRLQAIFLGDDQPPNNPLCELIEECIGIEIDYHRDFMSNICTLCRTQLEMFVTFKRISRQIHDEAISLNDNEKKAEVFALVKKRKRSSSNGDESLLEVMSCELDETCKNKKRRKVEMQPVKIKKQTKSDESKSESDDTTGVKMDRNKIYRMLWVTDDERNFEVIKENKRSARIRRDGYTFHIVSVKPDGSSLWNCDYNNLHDCNFKLAVGANGKIATITKSNGHTHDSEPVKLLKCPLGKGTVLNNDGTEDSIWLIGVKGKLFARRLIFRGHLYILRTCSVSTDTTHWVCKIPKCRVTAEVRGVFKCITSDGVHKHGQISKRELQEALESSRLDTFSGKKFDVITPFRNQEAPEKTPSTRTMEKTVPGPKVYAKLAKGDNSREFIVLKVRADLYKIRYLRYDYKLYVTKTEGSTLWNCVWEKYYNCKAVIAVSDDAKHVAHYGQVEHNHSAEPAPILLCDLGEYQIRNIVNDVMENLHLLSFACTYFRSRTILFRSHLYYLDQIINDETRWICVKTGSQGQQCSASIIITGSMESFLHKGKHCHIPLSAYNTQRIIKAGNELELSTVMTGVVESKSSSDVLNPMKQQLLAFPVGRGAIWDIKENVKLPFYFMMDHAKKDETPYKFFYQQYRYAFVSIDEHGTSQWICCKLLETSTREGTCTARVTIEGVFQRVTSRGTHNHDGVPETSVEYLCRMSIQ